MAGKSETFIKLGLVFFISLLSFAIGTLVGKEYSERQYKLSKLEPHEASSHGEHPVASGNKNKLSDEEIAKLAEEFVTDESVDHAKLASSKEVPPIEDKAAQAHAEQFEELNDMALQAAQELIEKKAVGAERSVAATDAHKKPSAVPTKAAASTKLVQTLPTNAAQENVGQYTVQVGSYLKEEEAKNRAETLRGKGYTAFYVPGTHEGKTYYRVNVGTYATQEEAKRANDKFGLENANQKGFVKEIVK
jgi:cell division septation protein DedD